MGIDIKTIGVIGAGQMGSGIAHVCASAGIDVL
ncbi:MAG TPA: 3-hydroxyacyl-CoA dehydrogenase NAD-binding domain-containing protein, partial [Beijerinckiaceae bacterium]|nr:3-hydroxyacyl-CoA dehydrogenase NAD-binding domain-containing protein [Beijerinckiaceae bacterium]